MYRIFLFYSAAVSGKGGKCEKFWTLREFVSSGLYTGKWFQMVTRGCDWFNFPHHAIYRASTRRFFLGVNNILHKTPIYDSRIIWQLTMAIIVVSVQLRLHYHSVANGIIGIFSRRKGLYNVYISVNTSRSFSGKERGYIDLLLALLVLAVILVLLIAHVWSILITEKYRLVWTDG